jgi:chaperonin GroES
MEWKRVDVPGQSLRDNIVPLPITPPSPVLFSLLEMIVQMGKDLAATKDILTGDNVSSQMPATLGLALIDQGLKVFTSIFKRIHRSLKMELKLLFKLNSMYLNPQAYQIFQDDPSAASQEDYDEKSLDIIPVTDPSEVTDMQRMARAQFLEQFRQDPMMNAQEIRMRSLQAANIDDPQKLFNQNQQPSPEVVKIHAEVEHKLSDIKIKAALASGQLAVMRSQAMLNIANAEAAGAKVMLAAQDLEFDKLERYVRVLMDSAMMGQEQQNGADGTSPTQDQPGGNPPVAGGADHAQGVALLGASAGGPQGAMVNGAGDGAGVPG